MLVEHEKQHDVAREFMIGPVTVSKLIRKAQKDKILDEIANKRDETD